MVILMPSHNHDWSPWVWDPWVLQSCWRRNCLVRGCFDNEATLDIQRVFPDLVIDHEIDVLSPDGDVEYTEVGLQALREHLAARPAPRREDRR